MICTLTKFYLDNEIMDEMGWLCGMHGVGKYIWEFSGKTSLL